MSTLTLPAPGRVSTWRRIVHAIPEWVPAAIVAIYILAAIFGPLLIHYNPIDTPIADRLKPPGSITSTGATAVLGTDALGRDIFAQVIYGARTSITIGFLTVATCTVVGVIIGIVAGYLGGLTDAVLSRLIDILLAFPGIVLAIVVAGMFEQSVTVVVVALSLTGWITFARMARSSAMALREREWVSAARVLGTSKASIMFRHVLPFVVGPIAAMVTLQFGLIILSEAGLSFLGIGLPPSAVSWGQVISAGKEYLSQAWWISAFPGIALALLVISVGLLGDSLSGRYQRGGDIAKTESVTGP